MNTVRVAVNIIPFRARYKVMVIDIEKDGNDLERRNLLVDSKGEVLAARVYDCRTSWPGTMRAFIQHRCHLDTRPIVKMFHKSFIEAGGELEVDQYLGDLRFARVEA